VVQGNVADEGEIHGGVAVHQHVPHPGHLDQARGELSRQPAGLLQEREEFGPRRRLAQPLVCHCVRRDVERSLDGELESVLDEPPFSDVRLDQRGPGHGAKLAEAGLHESQALGDQGIVCHAGR
jgi:hypothetical protein